MQFTPLTRNLARIWVPPTTTIGPAALANIVRGIPADDLVLRGMIELPMGAPGDFFPKAGLQSSGGAWAFAVGATLDLSNNHALDRQVLNLDDFIAVAGNVFRSALGDDGVATRIAVVREGFLAPDAVDGRATAARLLSLPPPFAGNAWEWDWRAVTSVERRADGRTFNTNTIATLRYAGVQILPETEPSSRLRVDLDVNTAPSEESRFTGADVDVFLRGVIGWQRELEQLVERHIGVNNA